MTVTEIASKQALHRLFSQAVGMPFAVRYWDGSIEKYLGAEPRFVLILRDPRFLELLQEGFDLGFGNAYMREYIDVQGDLADVVSVAIQTLQRKSSSEWNNVIHGIIGGVAGGVTRYLSRRSKTKQQQDIAHHYDLSNDFFRLWLDESMTYSCAYFHSPDDTIEEAQRQKIDHSLKKLCLRSEETLLDIGSGWGALIMRAARLYGVRSLGITLSQEQLAASCRNIEARGLEEQVDVRLAHYGTLLQERRQFDKIVSIGMIEHVGKAHLADFAQAVAGLLRPGGLALLHMITSPIEGPPNAWIDKYIFPGAYLPTVPEIVGHLSVQDLRIIDIENLRPHYRMTLDWWSDRFESHVPEIEHRLGKEFVRMWRLYLRSCSASFREGTIEIHQILVSHGKTDILPLTRDYLCTNDGFVRGSGKSSL